MTMTIQEAIEHCRQVATCADGQCHDDHLQLARWLDERQALGDDLRTRAAIAAMQGLISDGNCSEWLPECLVQLSVKYADALIKELTKQPKK